MRNELVRNIRATNKPSTFSCGLVCTSPRARSVSSQCSRQRAQPARCPLSVLGERAARGPRRRRAENGPARASRALPRTFFLSRFIRFLASYSARFFSRESTVVHTAFQRVFVRTSPCADMHLAQSPQISTRAINMNDNNLREAPLLRAEFVGSTLRSPRTNRFADEHREIPSRIRISTCTSCPAVAQPSYSSPRRAQRCEPIPHRSVGRDSGASRTRRTTRGASARTAPISGIAW